MLSNKVTHKVTYSRNYHFFTSYLKSICENKKSTISMLILMSLSFCSQAFAAGGSGTDGVYSMFNQILTVLQGLSIVVVTIAFIWAGYKVLFKGANVMEVGGPLLGAVLIGAAPWLADLLLAGS